MENPNPNPNPKSEHFNCLKFLLIPEIPTPAFSIGS